MNINGEASGIEEYGKKIDSSQKDILVLAKVVSIVMFLLGMIMTVVCYRENNKSMFIVSLIYGPLFLLTLIVTLITKKANFFLALGFALSYIMEFVYLKTGGQDGFGIFWMCIITFFTFLSNRKKTFFITNGVYVFLVILGFWTPLSRFCYQFSPTMRVRFPILYIIEVGVACFLRLRLSSAEENRKKLFEELIELQDGLQHQVEERTKELVTEKNHSEKLLIEVTMALASTIDAKDKYTSGHSRRVAEYSKKLAELLGKSKKEQQEIYFIALLHDIGKIGIPDEIINKRDSLTEEERNIVKKHPEIGYEIIKNITTMPALAIGVRWHHERPDGKGYPDSLTFEEIPEYARIISVADSYDAMTSNRSYRKYLSQDVARSEIVKGRGTQFSPDVADKMLELIDADVNYTMHE